MEKNKEKVCNAGWKLIVFDMDGTLYDLQDVINMNYRMQMDFYSECCGISCDEVKRIFEQNSILPYISSRAKSATEFFSKNGIDLTKWQHYRNKHFDVGQIDASKAVNDDIIRKFHQKYNTILLTSNSIKNVEKVLDHLQIKWNHYDRIICSDYNYPYSTFDKFCAMRHIREVFSAEPGECLSAGDRYETDIAPMLRLGGTGILVKKPKAMYDVYRYLEGEDCADDEKFIVYHDKLHGDKR